VERVAEIERASFSDPWSPASFHALFRNTHARFLVAERTGDAGAEVVGYVVLWLVVDEAEVANLAVAPAWRRTRVGAALLDAALAAAEADGARVVYLEVRDSNVGARALYASRGFEQVGRRKRYYRRPVEDALVMRRIITTVAS
jgi:ribosomal-protein-alanine N-acetyltransferase